MRVRRMSSSEDTYQAMLRYPSGIAFGRFQESLSSFNAQDIAAIQLEYHRQIKTIHGLLAMQMPAPVIDYQPLIMLGRRVTALLPVSVQDMLHITLQRAGRVQRRLRVVLEVEQDALNVLRIPWEVMVLGAEGSTNTGIITNNFLLLQPNVAFIRQVRDIGQHKPPVLSRPLAIQAFAATPADGNPIDLVVTRSVITDMLGIERFAQGWYEDIGTLHAMRRRISFVEPELVHLICHGEQMPVLDRPRSDLLLTHVDGYTHRVSAFELGPVLRMSRNLQVVIIQACHSGSAAPFVPERDQNEALAIESIALSLVRQGVPVVIAMQGEIAQQAVAAFVQGCYEMLDMGRCLDDAVAAGRIAMVNTDAPLDWSLPVIYQGSGQPEPDVWYTRLADRIEAGLFDPGMSRMVRGMLIMAALTLIVVGLARWSAKPPHDINMLIALLMVWSGTGLVGPAVIAAGHRGVRHNRELTPAIRRAALHAQWLGAYIGYALGGGLGLGLLAVLWLAGVTQALPPNWTMGLMIGIVCWALCFSYVITRSQVRSTRALAQHYPHLYALPATTMVIVATIGLIVAPFGLLWLAVSPLEFLPLPGLGALVLATILITLVLRFDT